MGFAYTRIISLLRHSLNHHPQFSAKLILNFYTLHGLTCKCLTRLWNIKFSPVKGERGSYTKVFEKLQALIFISVTSDI